MTRIDINGTWQLSAYNMEATLPFTDYFKNHESVACTIPGDIHSALLKSHIIEDPYWADNELNIQWVGRQDWVLERTFEVDEALLASGPAVLTFIMADTYITVYVNDQKVGECDNQFRRWRFDVQEHLKAGENKIRLLFKSAELQAIKEAEKLTYPIPYSVYPVSAKHRNLVRKTQCHSGWDWGPCIMSFGIYEPIELAFIDEGIIETVQCKTKNIAKERWELTVEVVFNAIDHMDLSCKAKLEHYTQTGAISTQPGLNKITFKLLCDDIQEWWPNGEGKAILYPLILHIGKQSYEKKIGFRTLEVKTEEDAQGGKGMVFSINERDIFCKGANWIPVDAIFGRATEERYEQLLQAAVEANMNMIRVWGGGLYEKDIFYDMCDEKGLLVWQDCMFSCSMYPSGTEFLSSVEAELRYQVPRLKDHPSLALWCGNNEDLGAISWYEESQKHRDRYVIDYDRLNEGVVGRVIRELDPDRTWWPSSPSAGPNDFSDNWHNDKRGDMHYWSVWHEGKDFEQYYSIKPRFVSEFGYQSFPSLSTVLSYADESMLNLTSQVMEHHQKNPRGNTIIIENFCRYYRFPSSFENMLYLSQVQQAAAMKLAIEYYRTLRGHCMGTLYWQLNDNWPVASWSSIEYGGKWKLLHYSARRFFAPVIPILYQKEDGKIEVYVVNDTNLDIEGAKLMLKFCLYDGTKLYTQEHRVKISRQCSTHICSLDLQKKPKIEREKTFLYIQLESDELYIENNLMLTKSKTSCLCDPKIKTKIEEACGGFCITVSCSHPAFEVALDAQDIKGVFSDNLFAIRPTAQKVVFFKTNEKISIQSFADRLQVYDLYSASH